MLSRADEGRGILPLYARPPSASTLFGNPLFLARTLSFNHALGNQSNLADEQPVRVWPTESARASARPEVLQCEDQLVLLDDGERRDAHAPSLAPSLALFLRPICQLLLSPSCSLNAINATSIA